jgi:hypothetical protein
LRQFGLWLVLDFCEEVASTDAATQESIGWVENGWIAVCVHSTTMPNPLAALNNQADKHEATD